MEPEGKEDKEEEDRVLMQLKKTQAHVSSLECIEWERSTYRKYTTRSFVSYGNRRFFTPSPAFFDGDLPFGGATHTRPLQITIECMGAKVLMVLIGNGSALNVLSL